MLRLFGIPESEIARTLREIEADGIPIGSSRSRPACGAARSRSRRSSSRRPAPVYDAFEAACASATRDTLFSEDGSTVDEQVAGLLLGPGATVAVAESCTGGLMAGRLTERAGSSAYVLGGARRLLQRGQDRRSRACPPS